MSTSIETESRRPILSADALTLNYHSGGLRIPWLTPQRSDVLAINDVSFNVNAGEIMGVVGESGSGKSSLARVLTGLQVPTSGSVTVNGTRVYDEPRNPRASTSRAGRRRAFRDVQMVFQDSLTSLNPGMSIRDAVAEAHFVNRAGRASGKASRKSAEEILSNLGMARTLFNRRPLDLSGGQRQRVNLARALACDPKIIIADEPTSSLDVSTRVRALELIKDVREKYEMTFVFISHDLNIVRFLCDRAIVMQRGRVVETGSTIQLFGAPAHDYTQELVRATPSLRKLVAIV